MKRATPIMLLLFLSGCTALGGERLRPASLELETRDGRWRLDGVQTAKLQLEDWSLRIVECGVATSSTVPLLEKLIVEIVNTSVDRPLVLEPDEITIRGFAGGSAMLGPRRQTVLGYNESVVLRYTPGLRAPVLPHPFILRVTVFRGKQFQDPQTVSVKVY